MGAGVVVESLARHGGDAAADSPSALADDGADAVEESSLETVSSAAGQDVSRGGEKASAIADGEEASGKGSGRGRRAANASGAAGSAPEGEGEAAAYGDTPAAAGPAEVSDEERAVFYSAVPKQREQEAEGKGRPKRKGKVAVAKGKVAGNLRIAGAVNAAGQKAKDAAQAARGRKVSVGLVVKIALAAVLVAVVAVGVSSMIAFNHVRDSGNDAQDIQGTWYLNGTNVAVQITPDEIVLTGDVAYDYQLDATNKTIQLEFGNLKGGGSYLFSLNRQQLMIVDGQDHATETLLEDFWWTIQALLAQARGEEYPLPTMENATYLNRAPAPGGAMTDATADASGKGLLSSGADGTRPEAATQTEAAMQLTTAMLKMPMKTDNPPFLFVEKVQFGAGRMTVLVRMASQAAETTPQQVRLLLERYPDLPHHACVNDEGPTFAAVMDHTSTAHLLEHLIISQQLRLSPAAPAFSASAPVPLYFRGATTWVSRAEGRARIEVDFADDLIALEALHNALADLSCLAP